MSQRGFIGGNRLTQTTHEIGLIRRSLGDKDENRLIVSGSVHASLEETRPLEASGEQRVKDPLASGRAIHGRLLVSDQRPETFQRLRQVEIKVGDHEKDILIPPGSVWSACGGGRATPRVTHKDRRESVAIAPVRPDSVCGVSGAAARSLPNSGF